MKSFTQQITETIPEFFFVWSIPEKKIVYLSENKEILGNKSKEVHDFDLIKNVISPEQHTQLDDMIENINKGKYHQDLDFIAATHKRPKFINIKTYPIRDNGKMLKVAGHVLDITQRIEREKEVMQESQKMEDVMHILAHDLRGPLGNIINLAKLQSSSDNMDSTKTFADMIVRIGYETSRLVDSMVEIISLDSEAMDLELAQCDLSQFIKSVLSPYETEIKDKEITLKTYLSGEDIMANIDLIKFRLVIQNLISNAIKFTDSNGSIILRLDQNQKDITISLKDDGIGIPKDKLGKVFDKFSPARRKGIRGEKSTGLGLAITKKIIDLHGGNIKVISIEGDGSEFIITLPKESSKVSVKNS